MNSSPTPSRHGRACPGHLRTDGTLLGGRIRYTQPQSGFRSGIEPVLLAATIPARPGQTVLEGGCGAGAALLCLQARIPDLTLHGIEQSPNLADLARANATANGFTAHITAGDLLAAELPPADHTFANPPYHPPGGTLPTDPDRRDAKHAQPGTITAWIRALAAPLRHRGTLTLIIATAAIPEAVQALATARCPAATLLPLWPGPGQPAKLALLRGIRGGNSPFRLLSGLVLHNDSGGFTPQAEAVLRHAANLPLCAERTNLPLCAERTNLPLCAERTNLPLCAERTNLPVSDRLESL